ncbi:hypothetical protein ACX16_22700, partial [Vibrio parahaemolyticus]
MQALPPVAPELLAQAAEMLGNTDVRKSREVKQALLAEARGHKVIPSVRTISELARKSLYSLVLEDLDRTLDKALAAHPYGSTDGFTLTLYFGRTDIEPLQDLARQLFEAFPCPLLLVEFKRNRTWHIEGIKPGAIHKLREDQEDLFANA